MNLRRVLRDAARATFFGCAALALLELIVTPLAARDRVELGTLVRFAALDVTLAGVAWLLATPVVATLLLAVRLVAGGDAAAAEERAARTRRLAETAVLWLWGLAAGALVFAAGSFGVTLGLIKKLGGAHGRIAALAVAAQVLLLVAMWGVARLVAGGVRGLKRHVRVPVPLLDPLREPAAALAAMALAAAPVLAFLLGRLPQLKPLVPWRDALAAVIFAFAVWTALRMGGRSAAPPRRRAWLAGAVAAYVALGALTLWKLGADPRAKYLAITSSPPLARLVEVVRRGNDFDRDGYGSLLGENDCAPFDRRIHPSARDIPDNGIDENCNGRDFSTLAASKIAPGERLPVPEPFRRDWNFLLITVDTLRYDHTGFGGYKEKRGRDTTPRLDQLVARSVSFEFANAPSAGTMASIPAILTSRFFHSGIALDDPKRRGVPPKLRPENVTLPEILKRKSYRTGVIVTHEYFNDWGMDQGVDDYDNSLGATPDPFRVTSPDVTDKALAWIAKQGDAPWFLWLHYIDPHGRYVAHPGERSFGADEEALYDGEIYFTDKHIGRLLDQLNRSPAGARSVVIITSDHGDGFKEHGFINHGMALYKELLHVPLIVYIPDVEPHTVPGPVSPIDILPTIADIAGIDISDLSIEGRSLVPQIFYGRDANDRVVFAETNWPEPLRAAITAEYKLIYNLKTNIYQLFDLRTDPWEHKNLWGRDVEGGQRMKELLDEWLERVYYSRDELSNQAQKQRSHVLIASAPSPKHPVDAVVDGTVRVLGWDVDKEAPAPGENVVVTVYFRCEAPVAESLKIEVAIQGGGRQQKVPAEGTFPTHRWRQGEYVKETFTVRLPVDPRERIPVQLRMVGGDGKPVAAAGKAVQADGVTVGLGVITAR